MIKSQIKNQELLVTNDQKTKDYFLFVGNVYPHKNAERMIKAFNIFLQYFPQTLLIIVGKEDFFTKG